MEARVSDINPELFVELKNIGLRSINLGVESGSQRMLNSWRKGITVTQSERAIQILNTLGIKYHINFILYDMYTTIDEMQEVVDFIYRTRIFETSECTYPYELYDNPMGILKGSEIVDELRNKELLCRYKNDKLTDDEQMIFDIYKPCYSYILQSEEMNLFIRMNDYWLNKLKSNRQFKSNNAILRKKHLCFQLFRKAVLNAKNRILDYESLDKKIDFFLDTN